MSDVMPIALPFKEAEEYWADKVKLSSGDFRKLSDEAKSRAFAVSGMAKGDELETVFNSIQKAIEGKKTFADFKKDCAEIMERRGWSSWRMENIFRTNVQGAYMAGRWKQVSRTAQMRPYGKYSAVRDSRTRPTHAALNGKVYPLDHPFWNTWWPPNGFKCRCDVITLSQRQVEKQGLTVEKDDPTGGLIEPVDSKTGRKMPARPLMPDTGFAHNPGKTAFGGLGSGEMIGRDTETVSGLKKAVDYGRVPLKDIGIEDVPDLDESLLLPSGKNEDWYIEKFKELYGENGAVLKDVMGDPVLVTLRSFMGNKTPGQETYKFHKNGHGESINLLGEMVQKPYEVWLTPQKDGNGRMRLTKRYISVWKTTDQKRSGGFAVFEMYRGELQGVTSFLPKKKNNEPDWNNIERHREGVLLYPKKSGDKTGSGGGLGPGQ